jgi:hypothetical protein
MPRATRDAILNLIFTAGATNAEATRIVERWSRQV